MPYSSSTALLTAAGLLNSKSVPDAVLGNAITSRIDCVLHIIAMMRSNPIGKKQKQNQEMDHEPVVYGVADGAGETVKERGRVRVPRAIPPWGGAPHLRACSSWLNGSFSESLS